MIWLDKLTFFSLCALVFVLPVSTAGVEVFSTLAVILFIVKKLIGAGKAARLGRSWLAGSKDLFASSSAPLNVSLALGVYFLIAFSSIFTSVDPHSSARGFVGKLLQGALLFYVVAATLNSSKRIKAFLSYFLLSAFILSLDAVWQFLMGKDIFKHNVMFDGRVSASMHHPNSLGAYLILILPLFFILFFSELKRFYLGDRSRAVMGKVVLFFIGLSVCLAVLGLTYSRGSWLGLLCGMIALAFLKRSWKVIVSFLAILVIVFTPIISKEFKAREATTGAVVSSGQPSTFSSRVLTASNRFIYWKDALHIIEDHPVFGTGLNTYARVIKDYAKEGNQFYAHNSYLQVAAELGPLGLGVLLWFFWGVLNFVFRRNREMPDGCPRSVMIAMAAGYIACLVQSGVDTTFYSVQLSMLLWMVAGLLMAVPRVGADFGSRDR